MLENRTGKNMEITWQLGVVSYLDLGCRKLGMPLERVSIKRIIAFWGLYWGRLNPHSILGVQIGVTLSWTPR